MKFKMRVFIPNPSGAYDPAPLHEFEDYDDGEGYSLCCIPSVGDSIEISETEPSYKVTSRRFDYVGKRVAVFVEETTDRVPS